jgi:hypothetical protein
VVTACGWSQQVERGMAAERMGGTTERMGGLVFASVGALVRSGLGDKERGSCAVAWPRMRWQRAEVEEVGKGMASSSGAASTSVVITGRCRLVQAAHGGKQGGLWGEGK